MIMKSVKINYNGKIYSAEEGVSVGAFLRDFGFTGMVCGGRGKCGKCRVICRGGLSAVTAGERALLTEEELSSGVRLACRTIITGDCEISAAGPVKDEIRTDGYMPDITLSPGFEKYGIAADIGTTTVALRLYDKNGVVLSHQSAVNPQRAYGGDVVSRMEAALKGDGDKLALSVRRLLNGMIRRAADESGISPDEIDGAVMTGNTVMLSFLSGVDTEPLTHSPFKANSLFGVTAQSESIGLDALSAGTPVYLPPCISAYVGADITCAVISSGIYNDGGNALLTDIGTNGETVLKCGDKLYACSTAAGPAFEGAGISMGMSGAVSAIDRVRALPDGTLEAHVIGDAAPSGICGSGIVDAVASLLDAGALDETGYLEDDPAVILPPVVITQADIRAVQLAKSAIHAGIKTLLSHACLTCSDIGIFYIAGGFGSYLDVKNAGRIGLIPNGLTDRVKVLGNAALSGASALLLCSPLRQKAAGLASRIQTVELAANPVFAEEYMNNMTF